MREAIGGTWLFGLVLTFIVFFASFLAISINYSKAFNVKNNIVDLIGKYEGNNCNARKKINDYLRDVGYLVPGECPKINTMVQGVENTYNYTGYDINGNPVASGEKAHYCISVDAIDEIEDHSGNVVNLGRKFYRVIVFFKIDLPLVGNLTTFRIKGETESIYFATEDDNLTC